MNLTTLRKESGLKAKKIAQELKISRTQLYNLEKGLYKLNDYKIEKFSELYNLSKEDIEKIIGGNSND